MKKFIMAGLVALAASPSAVQAQSLQSAGFYFGAEGGVNWLLNTTVNDSVFGPVLAFQPQTGFALGGVIGYDFVGPRVELEGVWRSNNVWMQDLNPSDLFSASGTAAVNQISVMANAYYDFNAGGKIVPYIGGGLGIAFIQGSAFFTSYNATAFAYQGIVGVGYNVNEAIRVNLDGRYYGTTSPTFYDGEGSASITNNNFSIMLGLQFKFGGSASPPPPPAAPVVAPPSFMVFFDWDRANLSEQALNTIKQASDAYKTKGNARITATGHTDTSGSASYNMALSLRRANAVKDALVRNGVPSAAISVVSKGQTDLLVKTADGVREPQNRRVEIVIQ
jgi:opacity protein-like surface antigen